MMYENGRRCSVANAESWSNMLTRYGRFLHSFSLLHSSKLDFGKDTCNGKRPVANSLPEFSDFVRSSTNWRVSTSAGSRVGEALFTHSRMWWSTTLANLYPREQPARMPLEGCMLPTISPARRSCSEVRLHSHVEQTFREIRAPMPDLQAQTVIKLLRVQEHADRRLSVACGDLLINSSQQATLECAVSFHRIVPPAMLLVVPAPK